MGARGVTGQVALVASPGGHVDEAFEIADRFAGRGERWWITAQTGQTEALLAQERVTWVPPVRAREAGRALRCLPGALRLLRGRRPARLVSTGSALTVPYMVAASAIGIPVTYVESATRLQGPSLTGRISEFLPRTSHECQASDWGRRGWQECASIFDHYRASATPVRPIARVVVTLGSEQFPFPRALAEVAPAVAGMAVAWQTGTTPVAGVELPGRVHPWWSGADLAAEVGRADAVITHAGVGSILLALRTGLCPVVIPRTRARGEHVDDHQRELVGKLSERGIVLDAGQHGVGECLQESARRVIIKE